MIQIYCCQKYAGENNRSNICLLTSPVLPPIKKLVSKFKRGFYWLYMKNQNKKVKYLQMDVTYYGKFFPRIKYYPKERNANFYSLREDDGLWFGLDLGGHIPINVHLFFFERRWKTNCEYCELDKNGEWNHYFDSNIYCENVKVKYI